MRDERGVGDPQNDFSDLLLIILRWPYRYDLKPFVRHMPFEFNTQLPQIRLKVK